MDAVVKSLLERPQPLTNPTKDAPLPRPSRTEAEAAVEVLLRWAGDDPSREGLRDTPKRVVRAYEELFSGYHQDAADVLNRVFEEVHGDDMVLVREIPFHRIASITWCPFSVPPMSPITLRRSALSGCRNSRGLSMYSPDGCKPKRQ
jgi:GTP cyclohydrolase I